MMGETSSYSARVINVNNYHAPAKDYWSFVLAILQNSDESIIVFDDDLEVLKFNDRLGTFREAKRRDVRTLDSLYSYIKAHYIDPLSIKKTIIQCYKDSKPKRFDTLKITGDMVTFKVVPVTENTNIMGVVLMARLWVTHKGTTLKQSM